MNDCLIIAHRGASTEAAENTRTAFLKALAQGADGFETDVQLNADGMPVLWHDEDLGKLGLAGRRIEEFGFEALMNLDFAGWFSPEQAGEKVLSLAEFLREFAFRTRLLIEIKQRDDEPPERQRAKVHRCLDLAALHRKAGPGLLFLSFHLASLVYAHQLEPDCAYVLNSEAIRTPRAVRRALEDHAFLTGLCLPIAHMDRSVTDAVRRAGKKLATYTCNTDGEIRRALKFGVDWIISDRPARARQLRDKAKRPGPGR